MVVVDVSSGIELKEGMKLYDKRGDLEIVEILESGSFWYLRNGEKILVDHASMVRYDKCHPAYPGEIVLLWNK